MPEANDDLSNDYLNQRNLIAQRSAGAELLQRYGGAVSPSGKEKEAATTEAPNAAKAATGAMGAVGAVVGDVVKGATETPRAIVGGVRDAYQEAIDLAKSAGDWIEKSLDLPVISVDGDGVSLVDADEYKGKRLADMMELPDVDNPESVTGNLIKGVSQFLTGFKVAGKILPMAPAASTAGKYGQAAVKGAVADAGFFDAHDQRLSNLIQSQPELQNPVTDYLAAKPDDSEAEGRFKNAIEGLGLGVLTDGFFMAMRSMRKAAVAKRTQADIDRVAGGHDEIRPEIADDALDVLGKSDQPLISPNGPPDRPPAEPPKSFGEKLKAANDAELLTPDEVLKPVDDPETFVNFSRIDSPDDVKDVMQQMADSYKGNIDQARRGEKVSFKEMELNAEQVNAFDTLMSRRVGDPLNAEQSIAARQLWASSADKLAQTARLASSNPSEANLFAFRKMMAVHQSIQNEVVAARTETARALASWRIPAGSGAERFAEIDNALNMGGGSELARDMAQRITSLADKGMIQEMDKFIEKSAWARSRDAVLEAWINGLLSGPKTHMVNMMSNTTVLFQQMYERGTAAKIADLLGDETSVQVGEATAQYFGMVSSLKDAFRYAGKSFITGESGFGLSKIDLPQREAISSEAFGMSSTGFLGRTVDTLGSAVRIPGRALGAADEFFKTIGYRMELNALALRQATADVNAGLIPADQLKSRIADIIENPPSSVRLAAIDQATYQTFTNAPGELTKGLQNIASKYPIFRVIMPFVRTPSNIMKYTFERTPLAPLMKQVRADIAAGGARRDLALARISTGTAILMVSADMAMSGQITGQGPVNQSERQALLRTGWQPYSVRVGDRYFAYNRMDPLGTTLGMAADMVEILSNDDYGTEKQRTAEEVAIAITMSIAGNAMSKTYMSGPSEFFEVMADPQRYGDSYFQRLAGSIVPTGVAEVARFNDPYMREAYTMVDAMRKRTPGLSDDLPVRRNLWGEPIGYQSGLGAGYDMVSPIYSKQKKASPIDEEILKHEMNVTGANRKTSFDGVTINLERHPEAYSRYVQLAGNELKHPAWNLGARDLLNEIVTGKHDLSPVYDMRSDGPDGGKADYIKKIINDYRELARDKILEEFPEIKAEYDDKKQQKRALNMPNLMSAR